MYLAREEEPLLQRLVGGKEALALIGPRRAGKTTLALKLLENWKENGGKAEYVDLEALSAPRTPEALADKVQSIPRNGLVVLDEVQSLEGWVKVVRQEVEKKERHFLITGSSASLLSKEIASSLGGRAIPQPVLSLSFRDACKWGIASLRDYMEIGGYPECVLRPNDASRLHKLYVELTILRDVAARKGVREPKPLIDLAVILLSEVGKTISAKKTSEILGISQPTFRSFVDGLNDAFLILSVLPFVRSPRERIVSDAKHYAYDVGLQKSVSVSTQDDFGRRLENIVAVELVRRGYSLSYFAFEGGECDFIAQKIGSKPLALQVWSGEGKVPDREWNGLEEGMRRANAWGWFLSEKEIETPTMKGAKAQTIEEWLHHP